MPVRLLRRLALFAALCSGSAGAGCVVQASVLTPIRYVATQASSGALSVAVVCDAASADQAYSLKLSAPGGHFDQASGTYVLGAVGRAGSLLQLQIVGASPALGGASVPVLFTGSQMFTFAVFVPAGQWQARGTPVTSLHLELTPAATGALGKGPTPP